MGPGPAGQAERVEGKKVGRGSSDHTARPRIISLRGAGDVGPRPEHIISEPLDAVEDAGVGPLQETDGEARAVPGEEVDDRVGGGEERAGAGDLEAHERHELRRGPAALERPAVQPEAGELVGGQVQPPRVQILGHVAEHVGELHGDAESDAGLPEPLRTWRRAPGPSMRPTPPATSRQ